MRLKYSSIIFALFILSSLMSCANRGTPSGGEKDVDPPKITRENPPNYSTNFKGDEIKIYFNEYVKIKDAQKQLIISPPMDTKPIITPLGGASEYITIKIKDTLEDNTTYAFNFGKSIVDNNEENPFSYYRYVFSTGSTIDSLSVKGVVVDAELNKPDDFISVMLYEADSTYSDSLVFKEKPRYITNTLDSINEFNIENIKAGTYKLLALKDENGDYKFNQKNDKIGFVEGFITVPTDSTYEIKLFKETPNFKAHKPKQEGEFKIVFPYEGEYNDLKIERLGSKPENYSYRTVRDAEKDSVYYWYKPKIELDSTFFVVTNKSFRDTLKHRYRTLKPDSLTINPVRKLNEGFDSGFTIAANIPLIKIDTTKINLIDKDSLRVPYKVEFDSVFNRYTFNLDKKEGQNYKLKMLPGTFTDFYEGINKDTLDFNFRTKLKEAYGNIRVNIRNAKFPLIVQLVNDNGEVAYEQYAESSPVVNFSNLDPKQYLLRAIYDTNKNGKFDSGNYLLGIQPERISYAPKIDVVRANFDFIIEFILLD